jgi:hypothetical protein
MKIAVHIPEAGRALTEVGFYHAERLGRAGQLKYKTWSNAMMQEPGVKDHAQEILPHLYARMTSASPPASPRPSRIPE